MPSAPKVVAVLAVLTLVLLPGCLRPDAEDPGAVVETANTTNETPETLPDGREFAAVLETNKTEEGVGGIEHKHDYWSGKEQIIVFDRDVTPSLTPVFERGDSSKVWIAFINLENVTEEENSPAALVYEGTGKVTFAVTGGPAWATGYQMSFRTAASDWSSWQPIAAGETFEYFPTQQETDMPHSFRSLWNWKLQAVSPVPVTGDVFLGDAGVGTPLHVTITVDKARNVADWPGHPAFYDGVSERIVANNKPGKSDVQHAADVLVYGVEPDQVVPDLLVSMGTRTLDVYVNITKLELPPGVENSGFQLFWRSADTRPDDLGHSQHNNETDGKTWAYWHLDLEDDMVDSPYQPTSRFSFKVLATPADDNVVYCYRCMPYTMEYVITVVARPDPAAVPATLDE